MICSTCTWQRALRPWYWEQAVQPGSVFSLLQNGHAVTVAARQPEKARTLADSFAEIAAKPIRVLPLEAQYLARAGEDTGLLVNTTPLGMNPVHRDLPLAGSSAAAAPGSDLRPGL